MDNKKKKDLAKIALAAFVVSASLPVAGNASLTDEIQGTYLAGFGCQSHNGSCGAVSNPNANGSYSRVPGSIDPSMQQQAPQGTMQRPQPGHQPSHQQPNSSRSVQGSSAKSQVAFEETQWEVSAATPGTQNGQQKGYQPTKQQPNSFRYLPNKPVAAAEEVAKPQAGVMGSEGSATDSQDSQGAKPSRQGTSAPSGSGMQMEKR